LTSRTVRCGLAVAMLIFALRFAVGWHFFSAGAEKLQNPNFRAAYFLEEAVGPFADFFHGLVPDALGKQRLDLKRRRQSWIDFKDALVVPMDGDEEKRQRAAAVLDSHLKKFDYFVGEYGADIAQHLQEIERYEKSVEDPSLLGTDFGRDWLKQKRFELRSATAAWLPTLKTLEESYRSDLIGALGIHRATIDALPDLTRKGWVDRGVTWLLLVVGALLLLGLATPLAALTGVGFLLSVMLTQPFWAPDANVSYFPYQLVELVALLFLAVVGAGRFGGLDYFFAAIRWRRS
jgi:uncharacterized membrane protein YphA (DoxX/SURF4 family)